MKSLLTSYYNRLSMKADQVVCNTNRPSQRDLGFGRNRTKRMSLHEVIYSARDGLHSPPKRFEDEQKAAADQEEMLCKNEQPTGFDFASSIKYIDDNDSTDLSNTSGEESPNDEQFNAVNTKASQGYDYVETFGKKMHDMSATCKYEKRSSRPDHSFYREQIENYDNSKLKRIWNDLKVT